MKIYFNIILPLPTDFSSSLTVELGSTFVMPVSSCPEFKNNISNNKNKILVIIIITKTTVHNIHTDSVHCVTVYLMDLWRYKDGVSVKPLYVKTLLLYSWLSTLLISVPCILWQINLKRYREIARVPIVLSHVSQMCLIYPHSPHSKPLQCNAHGLLRTCGNLFIHFPLACWGPTGASMLKV